MIESFFKQLFVFYDKLNTYQRYIFFGSVIVIVAIFSFFIVNNFYRENYAVLFTNLKPQNTALIVSYLKEHNIPYLISGGRIEVPSDVVLRARFNTAADGFLYDKRGFSFRDEFFLQNFDLNSIRKELERTIESIEPVEIARVNILFSKGLVSSSQYFYSPKVVVFIKLKPNMNLTYKQIKGIENLILAFIPRVKLQDIKIVDQYGNLLNEEDISIENNKILKTRVEYKKKVETLLEDKIVSILAPAVGGKDKVVAKVNVDFDFSEIKIKSTIYNPNKVIRKQEVITQNKIFSKPEKSELEKLSVSSDGIGFIRKGKHLDTINEYNNSKVMVNYEISTIAKDKKIPMGKIKRITVAVVVDGHYIKDASGKLKFVPLNDIELINIENLVKNAIGFNSYRGDSVSVSSFPFLFYEEKSTLNKERVDFFKFFSLFGYLILFGILLFFFKKAIRLLIKNNKKEIKVSKDELQITYDKIKELKEKIKKELDLNSRVSEEDIKYEILLDRIKSIIKERPQQIAKVLENLIKENKNKFR